MRWRRSKKVDAPEVNAQLLQAIEDANALEKARLEAEADKQTAAAREELEKARLAKKEALRKRLIWLVSAISAFCLFFITPIAEPFRNVVYGITKPLVDELTATGVRIFGIAPVTESKTSYYWTSNFAIDKAVVEGEPTPTGGCVGGSWANDHNAIPLNTEMYVEVTASRPGVALVASNFRYRLSPSAAKAVVGCEEGGDGAVTIMSYKVSSTKPLTYRVDVPGSSDKKDSVFLPLEVGKTYPVAVKLGEIDGPVVADWTADLVYSIDGERVVHNLGKARTSGVPAGTPKFVAGQGRWTKVN